jgi:hypothetical protein
MANMYVQGTLQPLGHLLIHQNTHTILALVMEGLRVKGTAAEGTTSSGQLQYERHRTAQPHCFARSLPP